MQGKSYGAVMVAAFLAALLYFSPSMAAPPLTTYGKLPGFELAAISSSGDHVAIIGNVDGERRLIVLDKENKPLLIQNIGQLKVRELDWAGDDRVLLPRSNTANLGIGFTANKAELYSTLVIPIDGGKAWDVLSTRRNVTGGIRANYGLTQRGGRWYGYFSAMTLDSGITGNLLLTTANPALYEVDLQTGKLSN